MENILKSSGLVLVNSQNYNKWQYEQFRKYIGTNVLEIGCGLGNITQHLVEDAKYLLSVDTKAEAINFIKQRLGGRANFNIECRDVFEKGLANYAVVKFDTIVFSNVLEHISDDLKAMKICYDILKPSDGRLLLLVPAHKFLYGTLDKESGHWRRYTRDDIVKLAELSNFRILDLYKFNFIGALGWYLNYCVLKRKKTNNTASALQMNLYDKAFVNICRYVESFIRPPLGLSFIAILEAKQ
jgi:SAM-dependent methyltransferase